MSFLRVHYGTGMPLVQLLPLHCIVARFSFVSHLCKLDAATVLVWVHPRIQIKRLEI